MSKFGKFKEILSIGSAVAKPFVPGSVGKVLDAVNGQLEKGGASAASSDAIKQLAADNDEQTAAILALHERVKALEAKQ
jgi:hypothetical protein